MTTRLEDELDLLLHELEVLTDEGIWVLADTWQQEDEAARRRAWQAAKPHIERTRRGKLLDRARHAVGRWAAAGRADYGGFTGALLGQPTDSARLRMAAAPAILDAAAALLAQDGLDEDELAVLTRPWNARNEEPSAGPND